MRSAIGLISARGWANLCSLGSFLLVGRVLTPYEFGLFALASSITLLPHMMVAAGYYEYVLGRDPGGRHDATAQSCSTLSGIAACLLIVAFHFVALHVFHAQHVATMLLGLALVSLLWGTVAVQEAALIRDGRGDLVALVAMLSETAGLLALLAMISQGHSLYALVGARVATMTFTAAGYAFLRRARLRFRLEGAAARQMSGFSGGLFATKAMEWAHGYGMDLLLGLCMPTASLGVYRMGSRLFLAGQSVIAAPSLTVLGHLGRAAVTSRARLEQAALRTLRLQAVLGAPAFAAVAALAMELLPLVVGKEWRDSGTVLALFCLFGPAAFGAITGGSVLLAHGRSIDFFRYQLAMAVPTTAALALGALSGPVAAAVAKALCGVAYALGLLWMARELAGPVRRACARTVLVVLLATACMTGAGFASAWLLDSTALALLLGLGGGAAAYVTVLRLLDPGSYRTLRCVTRLVRRWIPTFAIAVPPAVRSELGV